MLIRNKEYLAPLGVVCVTLSLILGHMGGTFIPAVPFVEGVLLGFAFSCGCAGIIFTAVGRRYE